MKIIRYADAERGSLLLRTVEETGVGPQVAAIIADVAKRGDDALIDYAKRFDGATLSSLDVHTSVWSVVSAGKTLAPTVALSPT